MTLDVKNVHKKVLNSVNSRRFGNNPFISRMFQPLGQNQTFTVHARQMMHMLFETCAREELNKLELYVHAAGGKRFKFEDNPSFFSLSGCSTTTMVFCVEVFPAARKNCPVERHQREVKYILEHSSWVKRTWNMYSDFHQEKK